MRFACAAGDRLRLGAGRVDRAALSLEGVQPIGDFLNIGLLFRLVDLHLHLLDLGLRLPLVVLRREYIPLEVFNLLDLLLQDLLLGPQLVLVGFEHLQCVGFQFVAASHRILKQGDLSVDEVDLGPHLPDLPLYHLVHVLVSGDLLCLLPFLRLRLQLEVVFLFEDDVDLDRAPLLRQRLLIDFDFPLDVLILHAQLLRLPEGLIQNRKRRLRLIAPFDAELLELRLHGADSLEQFLLLADFTHGEGEGIVEPALKREYFFYLSERIR